MILSSVFCQFLLGVRRDALAGSNPYEMLARRCEGT
jgi:hypothetical protein